MDLKNKMSGNKFSMQSQPKMPLNRFSNSDTTTPSKLQSLGNKNRSIPPISGSSFSNENENIESNYEENQMQQNIEQVETKVASKAITVATKGVVHGKAADKLAEKAIQHQKRKTKIKIIVFAASFVILFLIIFGALISITDNTDMGESTAPYISNEMSDEDLIKQLKYYGYCNNESDCKSKGIYKFFEKLKDTYSEYSKACGSNVKNDEPCGVRINTAVIIETINYYQKSGEAFNSNNTEVTEEDVTNSGFSLKNIFSGIVNKFNEQKEINNMSDEVEALALAQTEFVEDNCGKKYYQISFNKYVSYLKYGKSSTHPNYSGNAVKIDTCSGPSNDYIGTEYDKSNTGAANTKGEQIVQYALQFVGNPYVWGGTSLTEGADCSGFTMKVFENFGITLPHSSTSQLTAAGGTNIGTDVSKALPGDLIVYGKKGGVGHVAIYMGGNQIVHASDKKSGIKISNDASYRKIEGIVRYWEG